tara:strand:- start:140 stop:889 length:750 start_codon:yes stop_codon:yes gene_type:complete
MSEVVHDTSEFRERLAKLKIEEKNSTNKYNKIYLVASLIIPLVLIALYASIIVDNPYNLKNGVREKYPQNIQIQTLIDFALPITSGLLTILPMYMLMQEGISKAMDNKRTTSLGLSWRMTKAVIALSLAVSGIIVPLILMKWNDDTTKNTKRKKRNDLTWCIVSMLIGTSLLILLNIYILRYLLLGTAILASMNGKTIISLLKMIGVTTFSVGTSTYLSYLINKNDNDEDTPTTQPNTPTTQSAKPFTE